MRLVLDTNVWVSAFLWGGTPRKLIALAYRRGDVMVLSPSILAELTDVLSRPKFSRRLSANHRTAAEILAIIRGLTIVVPDRPSRIPIPADPSDEKFIACALTAPVDALISGDRHLLVLKDKVPVPILTPTAFLRRLG